MKLKALRDAYTTGFRDAEKRLWLIDTHYPRPSVVVNRTIILSDGTKVTGNPEDPKPNFGKAKTPDDATALAELWVRPTMAVPDDDAEDDVAGDTL